MILEKVVWSWWSVPWEMCASVIEVQERFLKKRIRFVFQKANSGNLVWTIMMCLCGFISYNKWLQWGGYVCVGAGSVWNIYLPCFQFCWELQTVLRNKVYFLEKVTVAIVGFSWADFVGSLPLCVPEVRRATFFSTGIMTVSFHNPTCHTASRHGLLSRNQKWKERPQQGVRSLSPESRSHVFQWEMLNWTDRGPEGQGCVKNPPGWETTEN